MYEKVCSLPLVKNSRKHRMISGGLLIGLINGLFGGGGGMIAVPMLALLGLKEKEAHATAIAVILPICLVSALIYSVGGFDLITLPVTIGNVSGGILGAFLLKKLPKKWVGIIFSLVMFYAGIKMLFF